MNDRPDPYTILGVSRAATPEEIQAAYRRRVKVVHPDRIDRERDPAAWAVANRMLRDINDAYFILSNENRRRIHNLSHISKNTTSTRYRYQPSKFSQNPSLNPKAKKSNATARILTFMVLSILLLIALGVATKRTDNYPLEGGRSTPPIAVDVPPRTSRPLPPASIKPAGCESNIAPSELPNHGRIWSYSERDALAPLEIRAAEGAQYLVKIEENERPVAVMFIQSGSAAEFLLPLGTYTLKYATGDGEYWCGHESRYPFGPETQFRRSDEAFLFADEGTYYSGYTVELILQRGGNLHTYKMEPEMW